MAKKLKARKVADLTLVEINKLAGVLHGTGWNVYTLLKTTFGIDDNDESIFDRLEKEGRVFKCELCSTWKTTSEKDSDLEDYCVECMDPEAE